MDTLVTCVMMRVEGQLEPVAVMVESGEDDGVKLAEKLLGSCCPP